MSTWTTDRVELLKRHWENGLSCSLIAEELGEDVTKNAVIGKVHRLKLKPRRTMQRATGWRWYLTPKQQRDRRAQKQKLPPLTRSNFVVAGPAPKPRPVVVGLPVNGVNTSDLVAGWIAQNGGPRKFRIGDGGDPFVLKMFMEERGFEVKYPKAGKFVSVKVANAKGRARTITKREFVAFVDAIRRAEGLEPLAA